MCCAPGQRSRTTRSPSGSGLRAVTSSRVTTRSRWRSRSKRESTKSATTRSLFVQIAVAKPSWRSASSASAAWGSSTACSMARRSCAWGMARISASRCGACARTWPKISAPDHRNSRTGSAIPRSRTKTSISRPTALRSRGELTRVWSRSKTQTGGCAVTASGAMGGPWFHVQQEVAQELDAAAIEGAVGHDQLDVLGQAWPDAFGGLLRAHDRARALQHAIERPRIVGGGEDRRDVEQPRRLHGPEEILAARRGGADEAHGGTLRQFREAQERLDAGLGEEGDHGRAVHGHAALHLMNVKEGGDDDAIALEEAGIAPGLGVEFLHQHAIHVERQLRLELIAVARQLGVVAFDEHGPLPDRLGHLPRGPARGEGGHELVLGEAQATRPGEALADQTGQAVGRASRSRLARARLTVFGLMRRKPAIFLTVGSCMPGFSAPVETRCRIWVMSCTCTGTALFRFTRSPDGGAIRQHSRAMGLGGRSSRTGGALGGLACQRPAQPDQRQPDGHPQGLRLEVGLVHEPALGRHRPSLTQPVLRDLLCQVVVQHVSSFPGSRPVSLRCVIVYEYIHTLCKAGLQGTVVNL